MKRKNFTEHLAELIAEEKKRDDKSELLFMLTTLHNLITTLAEGYLSSSKKVTWLNINKALNLIMTVLMEDRGKENYDKINEKYIKQQHFIEFVRFIYDKKSWEEWDYYELEDKMSLLFLYFFPDKILQKIIMPIKLLDEVNLSISRKWGFQKSISIRESIKREFIDTKFMESIYAYHILIQSMKNEKKIKNFTNKEKRLITYNELNDLMKNELEFWGNLFNRDNFKIKPNKKYTNEMFEYTTQLKFEGLKDYVACRNTLSKFGYDSEKDESYAKQFRAHMKKRN